MIQVTHLTKQFSGTDGQPITAVDNLSFEVAGGEVFGLLGPNGAGKTTTLRMMLGLLKPSSGDSEIHGIKVSQQPDEIKRRVGFVSTSVGVYQWLTVREMLLFVADLYDVDRPAAVRRVRELAVLLEFQGYLDRRCGVLSTGQKQRINLARALIHDPPVMLLDEPTRGLDIIGSQVVFQFLQELRRQGRAVIICTHRLDEAERFADRFGLLHHGRLQHSGTLEELRRQTQQRTLTDMFLRLLRETPEVANAAAEDLV
ncbi:MAG: ATP-binding cassette domain-containing protein [Planctomycetaceae bacterium]